jgi:hypothetical protein
VKVPTPPILSTGNPIRLAVDNEEPSAYVLAKSAKIPDANHLAVASRIVSFRVPADLNFQLFACGLCIALGQCEVNTGVRKHETDREILSQDCCDRNFTRRMYRVCGTRESME